MKTNSNAVRGEVTEALSDQRFRVKMADGRELLAYPSGKIRVNHIKIAIGDKVDIVLDPYQGTCTNRITKRI